MSDLFDELGSPHLPSASISLSQTEMRGETIARPLFVSEIPAGAHASRDDLMTGLEMLGMKPTPQMFVMSDVIDAVWNDTGLPVHAEAATCIVRRAGKTTMIWADLLGRCTNRPGYQVVTTAQSGIKARERFLSVARPLMRNNVGKYRVLRGAAAEAIEWENGSRLWVVTPEAGAFRGDGAHVVFVDEAQEHGPEASAEIIGGALSLMDTTPGAQLLIAGTAGAFRGGMLWDSLESGRAGRTGIIEYAVPDDVDVALDERTMNDAAILACHPGIGTLTTLDVIRARFDKLGLAQFRREYAGQWPHTINTRAIDAEAWQACRGPLDLPRPARFAMAFDVAPDQSAAALVAAWRDDTGRPYWEVLGHDAGDAWVARKVWEVTRAHPGTMTGYDAIGPNQAIADRLDREARPRPKLHRLGTRDIVAAAATVNQAIASRSLRYRPDVALDAAVPLVTRRAIGDGSFAWGRLKSGDISVFVAGSNALKTFDATARPSSSTSARPRMTSSAHLAQRRTA